MEMRFTYTDRDPDERHIISAWNEPDRVDARLAIVVTIVGPLHRWSVEDPRRVLKGNSVPADGDRSLMNDDTSGIIPKADPKTDWRRLRSMTDEEVHAAIIDDPDAKPTDETFWEEARVVMPRRKETVTMRLDADLLEWFRRERGYQTRINAILRAYMKAHPSDR